MNTSPPIASASATASDAACAGHDAGVGCYVHLPFCDRICPYCDFAVAPYRNPLVERYLNALAREIGQWSSLGAGSPKASALQTLYFGGGTPSALPLEALRRITRLIFEAFEAISGSVEFTLEANPSRNRQDLEAYRRMGVNRLSIGVQSLDDGELHRLGRTHDAAQARDYVLAARKAGFSNVSVDLIAGSPGQSLASLERTLQEALALSPDHVSLYGLTIEEGTPYSAWRQREPGAFADDDALAVMLERGHDLLTRSGFIHYEISNFARPGHECAHNVGYWRQRTCHAFGVSAAGYEDGLRYANTKSVEEYVKALEAGVTCRAYEERLSAKGRLGEAAMLALRTSWGIDFQDFRQRFEVNAREVFAPALAKCTAAGLIQLDARGARLTRSGQLLANSVCAEFIESPGAVPV